MSDRIEKAREEALAIISELTGSDDMQFYLDIAFDAIGSKLAKNELFKDLDIETETAGISEVLEALVRAEILDEGAEELPDEFDEAIGDLYPFGNTPEQRPREILTKLHDRLKEAIEALVKKHAKAKSQRKKIDQ